MILASERIGLRCLVGKVDMDGYIDFGVEGFRKPWFAICSLCFPPMLIQVILLRMGDGKTFPRNRQSDEMLARLATELVKADVDNWHNLIPF